MSKPNPLRSPEDNGKAAVVGAKLAAPFVLVKMFPLRGSKA